MRFVYADAQKQEIRDHLDRLVLSFHYSGGQLSRISDRAGREVRYRYTGDDLVEVIDVLGQSTHYAYNAKHQLTRITDPLGRVTAIDYVSMLDPPVGAGGLKLGKEGAAIFVPGTGVSSNAPTSGYRVSRVGRLTDPAGQVTSYETTYDKTARQFSTLITHPGDRRVLEVHDLEGRLLEKTHGSRPVHKLQRDGLRIETTFDERGLATRVEYDELRQPLLTTHPDGTQTRNEYEPIYHRLVKRSDEAGIETRYGYDPRGNLLTQTEAFGRPEERLTTYTYDTLGQMTSRTLKGATEAQDLSTTFTYDEDGNLASLTDPEGSRTSYTYNALGLLLSKTDPLNHTTRYEYDLAGRLTAVIDAQNQRSEHHYDAAGNRIRSINPLNQTTHYQYDALDRLTQVTDALGGISRTSYHPGGQLMSRSDAQNLSTTYRYDSEARLIETTDPAGNATVYRYGESGSGLDGLLTAIVHPSFTEELKYDSRNRLTQRTQVLDADTRLVSQSGYDATGNLIAQTDPKGRGQLMRYDALRRQVESIDSLGGRTLYQYDAARVKVVVASVMQPMPEYGYQQKASLRWRRVRD